MVADPTVTEEGVAVAAELVALEATGHGARVEGLQRRPAEVPVRVAGSARRTFTAFTAFTDLTALLGAPLASITSITAITICPGRANDNAVAYFARVHFEGSNVLYAIPASRPKGRGPPSIFTWPES